MKRGVYLRLLVPSREPDGSISYRSEMHFLRLPLKREERRAVVERLVPRS
jgi:hypothetical protein